MCFSKVKNSVLDGQLKELDKISENLIEVWEIFYLIYLFLLSFDFLALNR